MVDTINILEKETGLPWVSVENSSNIEGYAYNSKGKILWILFKMNKANRQLIYAYPGVNEGLFDDFQKAESKGKWVNTHLVRTGCKFNKYELVDKRYYE